MHDVDAEVAVRFKTRHTLQGVPAQCHGHTSKHAHGPQHSSFHTGSVLLGTMGVSMLLLKPSLVVTKQLDPGCVNPIARITWANKTRRGRAEPFFISPRALIMQTRRQSTSSNLYQSGVDVYTSDCSVRCWRVRTSKARPAAQRRQADRAEGGQRLGAAAWAEVMGLLLARLRQKTEAASAVCAGAWVEEKKDCQKEDGATD